MRHARTLLLFVIAMLLLNACGFGIGPTPPTTSGDNTNPPATSASTGNAPATTDATSATGATGGSGNSGTQVTISFAATEDDRPVYEPLIHSFEAENPDVRVQFVNFDSLLKPIVDPGGSVVTNDEESIQDIITAADTARLSATPEAIEKGWVRDLTPLMQADAGFNRDDFYPGALQPVGTKNGIYVLPHTLFFPLLSYNKELWQAHNLPAPKPDQTWQDLLALAQQLTQKSGDKVGTYGLIDWNIGMALLQNEITTAGLDPANLDRLDRPEIAAAVDHVAELSKAGTIYILPNRPTNVAEFQNLISGSQVAIWASDMLVPGSTVPFQVGTMAYPEKGIGGDGYIMSSGTQHPEAAWRWLSYLSRKEVRQPGRSPNLIGQLPARKSVAEQSGYWNQLDEEAKTVINSILDRANSQSSPPTGFDLGTDVLLQQALDSVVYGGSTTRDALQLAQTTREQQIAQQPPQPTDTGNVVVVATPVPAAKPGAVIVNFGVPRDVVDETRRLANAFNADNPDIFVQIKDIGPDNQPLDNRTSQVDCFASVIPPNATTAGALLDLQPLIDADANFPINDYPPMLLQPFRDQGHLYGLPYAVNLLTLNYNQTAFDTAGLAHPTDSWTMDDFLNAAKTLTAGTGANKQYGFGGARPQDVIFFVERFDASVTTGSGDDIKPNFTDPKVIEALKFYIDLLRNYSPHTKLEGYIGGDDGNSALPLISSGRVGIWLDFGTNFFGLSRGGNQVFTRAIAPPPLNKGLVTPEDFQASALYISAKAQQPAACWAWMKYLGGIVTGVGGAFPARLALTASDDYAKQAPAGAAEIAAAYRAAFQRTSSDTSTSTSFGGTPINYFWFFRAVDRALQGNDLERELADAQTLTEQYQACVKGGTPGDTCGTQVDPSYNG